MGEIVTLNSGKGKRACWSLKKGRPYDSEKHCVPPRFDPNVEHQSLIMRSYGRTSVPQKMQVAGDSEHHRILEHPDKVIRFCRPRH